jgi:hypothetical protein
VQVVGKVTFKAGVVNGVSGRISGIVTSDGYKVVESAGGSPLSASSVVKAVSGVYSALLTAGSGVGSVAVRFQNLNTGFTVGNLVNLATGRFGFYYYLSAVQGPQLELRFTGPNNVGHVDITVMPAQNSNATTGSWKNQTISSASTRCVYYGEDDTNATAFNGDDTENQATSEVYTLGEIPALINAEAVMTAHSQSASRWKLTRVGVELWEAGSRTCYVDDVLINGTTYTLEPTMYNGGFVATK